MNKYIIIICISLGLSCAALGVINENLRQEKRRIKGNQEALIEKVSYYKTKAGKSAASVRRLELNKSELKAHNSKLIDVVDDLKIKLKRVNAATTTATQTNVVVKTVLRDSIVYVAGKIEKVNSVRWHDAWTDINCVINPDSSVDMTVQARDTLYQVVHRVPRRFLFFRWGTKAIRQEITSSNPHTRIIYTEYVELQ